MEKPLNVIYDFVPATGQTSDGIGPRDRRHGEVRAVPPHSWAAFLGDERRRRGRRLPRRRAQRTCLLRGLPHRPAQVRPDGSAGDDQRCDKTLQQQTFTTNRRRRHAGRRRSRGRQPAEQHPQDPHGAAAGEEELQLRWRAVQRDNVSRRTSAIARSATTGGTGTPGPREERRPRRATTGRPCRTRWRAARATTASTSPPEWA